MSRFEDRNELLAVAHGLGCSGEYSWNDSGMFLPRVFLHTSPKGEVLLVEDCAIKKWLPNHFLVHRRRAGGFETVEAVRFCKRCGELFSLLDVKLYATHYSALSGVPRSYADNNVVFYITLSDVHDAQSSYCGECSSVLSITEQWTNTEGAPVFVCAPTSMKEVLLTRPARASHCAYQVHCPAPVAKPIAESAARRVLLSMIKQAPTVSCLTDLYAALEAQLF